MIPIQHHHVERHFTAAIADRFKVDLLGPSGGLCRGREIGFACASHVGETGNEDQSGVGRLQEKGHECPGQNLGACHVDVICPSEALAQGGFALNEFNVEGCSCEGDVKYVDSIWRMWEMREREPGGEGDVYQRC